MFKHLTMPEHLTMREPSAPRRTAPAAAVTLLALSLLAGCASTPPLNPVDADASAGTLPAQWTANAGTSTAPAVDPDARWWRVLGDATLDARVDEALQHNRDLAQGLTRVAQARAALRQAESARSVQLDASASATRTRQSIAIGAVPAGASPVGNALSASLGASWEPDLWGRTARGIDAARAGLAASEAEQAGLRLLVAGEVTRAHLALAALDARRALLTQTLAAQGEALALQRLRERAGETSQFELRQLEAEQAALQAELPALDLAREQAQAALLVLLGRAPADVMAQTLPDAAAVLQAQAPAPAVPAGLPASLLQRRPDLLAARQRLLAAQANAEVVRADGLPRVALTGSLGSLSPDAAGLFSGPAFVWSLGAALTQSLWDGGRRQAQSEAAQAQRDQALAAWQAAVAQAFGDVRQALAAQLGQAAVAQAQRERIAALSRVLELAELRQRQGVASQLEVLDARRALLAARGALVEAERARREAWVQLAQALGGGVTAR